MENSNVGGGAQKLAEVLKSRRARSNIRGLKVDRAQVEVGKNFVDGKLGFMGEFILCSFLARVGRKRTKRTPLKKERVSF